MPTTFPTAPRAPEAPPPAAPPSAAMHATGRARPARARGVRAEWRPIDRVAVVVVWLGAYLGSAAVFRDALAEEFGLAITRREALLAQGLDAVLWLALLPPLFAAFDAAPVALRPLGPWPRARVAATARALATRGAALLAATLAHGVALWALEHALGPALGVRAVVLAHPLLTLPSELADSLGKALPPALTYWALGRVVAARARRRRARETEEALRRAREQALATQLQPHFLFNALNGIALLVRTDPRAGERMIVRLSSLLRETLEAGRLGTHTLGAELALLDHYLALQRMRFGERLAVALDVPAALHDRAVPALLLQPVVENAIRHGLEHASAGGTVWVRARDERGVLVLEVDDDGVGLDAPDARAGTGVGLATTRARLLLAAGLADEPSAADALLDIAPRPGGGVRVTLRLPAPT